MGQKRGRERQMRRDESPFGISQIRFVTQPIAPIVPPSGGVHIAVPEKASITPRNHVSPATQPLSGRTLIGDRQLLRNFGRAWAGSSAPLFEKALAKPLLLPLVAEARLHAPTDQVVAQPQLGSDKSRDAAAEVERIHRGRELDISLCRVIREGQRDGTAGEGSARVIAEIVP